MKRLLAVALFALPTTAFAAAAGPPPAKCPKSTQVPTIAVANSNFNFLVGSAIEAIVPTVTGANHTVSISPDITQYGLTFDSNNGKISGTPTSDISQSYTLTATNCAGSNSAKLYVGLNAVVAATAPAPSQAAGCEYTLNIADFQSTNFNVLFQAVYAGCAPIAAGPDGLYHIPLTDSNDNPIIDAPCSVPVGVWQVERNGNTLTAGNSGHQNDNGGGSGYVSYNVAATLSCNIVKVTNVKGSDGFEDESDGISIIGKAGNDQYTVTGNSIFAESSTTTAADLYTVAWTNPCQSIVCGPGGGYCDPVTAACTCATGETLCNNLCVDTTEDPHHCGACNLLCSPGQTCTNSVCVCQNGLTNCNTGCVDETSDVNNCGGCNVVCGVPANTAAASCSSSTCGYTVCNSGFLDCNGVASDGCEVNGQTDGNNCGACGQVCGAGTACVTGACQAQGQSSCGPGQFSEASYAGGPIAQEVATGDFNGDGFDDLVVTNFGNNAVNVFLNQGDGTFGAAVNIGTLSAPWGVAVGDLNGDGAVDIAAANYSGGGVSVFLNRGDGTFGHTALYPANGAQALAIADVDGDGYSDLVVNDLSDVVGNANGNAVMVLLNNGDGTFAAGVVYGVGQSPQSLVVSDVNGDCHPDIVTGNFYDNTVSVLLNNGDGTFAGSVAYPTGTWPSSVALGDFDGDGQPDLAVANLLDNNVCVMTNQGGGLFSSCVTYSVTAAAGFGNGPRALVVADLNGDGNPDLATASYYTPLGTGALSVFFNQGDGTFAPEVTIPSGTGGHGLVADDLNGDGRTDLAEADNYNSGLTVALNSCGASVRRAKLVRCNSKHGHK